MKSDGESLQGGIIIMPRYKGENRRFDGSRGEEDIISVLAPLKISFQPSAQLYPPFANQAHQHRHLVRACNLTPTTRYNIASTI
jgi:hypothetical protein